MKAPVILLLLFVVSKSFSQDWNIINKNNIYNFKIDKIDLINSTIFIDSSANIGKDSIFYLNRIVIPCNTCPKNTFGIPLYASYDQPQFLQREIIKTDSCFIFKSPQYFNIRYKSKLYETWLFDSIKNIEASVIEVKSGSVFNTIDSIKIIALSTNDTIVLSKSFGILRFDPIYEKSTYQLAGIENLIGESLPNFYDFFSFSIGDVFEYHGALYSPDDWTQYYIEKAIIIGKSVIQDTLRYNVSLIISYWQFWNNTKLYQNKETWSFVNYPQHPTNLYNNQLLDVENYKNNEHCNEYYQFTKVIVSKDSDNKYCKTIGAYRNENNFYSSYDTLNRILKITGNVLCDEDKIIYKEGVGILSHTVSPFEGGSNRELVAYKIGNDTTGVLTNDDQILSIKEMEENTLSIYPNPSRNIITVSSFENSTIKNISVIDLSGKILTSISNSNTISIQQLIDGIYILKIEVEEKIIFQKIIKNTH